MLMQAQLQSPYYHGITIWHTGFVTDLLCGDIGDNAFHRLGLVTEPALQGLGHQIYRHARSCQSETRNCRRRHSSQ
jgi:hypothetical protein